MRLLQSLGAAGASLLHLRFPFSFSTYRAVSVSPRLLSVWWSNLGFFVTQTFRCCRTILHIQSAYAEAYQCQLRNLEDEIGDATYPRRPLANRLSAQTTFNTYYNRWWQLQQ
jgi:hypothetical protein